jgi:hypothetical protein
MAGDQPMRRVALAMLALALGQHGFLLRFQQGEAPNFFEIAGEA